MILMDEEGQFIHATISKDFCSKFVHQLEEGKVVYLSTFGVQPTPGTTFIVENQYRIVFYIGTKVKPSEDFNGPTYGFRFKSFDSILKDGNQSSVSYDLIGHLKSAGKLDTCKFDGNKTTQFMQLELEDLMGKKLEEIALWSDHATKMHELIGDRKNSGPVVVILQFVRHRIFNGNPSIQSMSGVTKIWYNEDIPDILDFKKNLLANRSHDKDDNRIAELPTKSSYSMKDDFLKNYKITTCKDIRAIKEPMYCVLVATIKEFDQQYDWVYLGCIKCNQKCEQNTVNEKDDLGVIVKKRIAYTCTNARCGQETDVEYKYKIPLLVADSTHSTSLTLFDRQAQSMFDKTAGELRMEMRNNIITKLVEKITTNADSQSDGSNWNFEPNSPQPSFTTPTSVSKLPKFLSSVTGDNSPMNDEAKNAEHFTSTSVMRDIINVDDEPLSFSSTKKLLSPKKEKEDI